MTMRTEVLIGQKYYVFYKVIEDQQTLASRSRSIALSDSQDGMEILSVLNQSRTL